MSISKFNKNTKVFTFQAPEGFQYYAMRDLYNTNGPEAVYTILGWFFHTGKFGEQPVFITPKYYINGPKHMCEQCRQIMADAEAVNHGARRVRCFCLVMTALCVFYAPVKFNAVFPIPSTNFFPSR